MQIRICADVTCECWHAGASDRRLNRGAAVVVVASERGDENRARREVSAILLGRQRPHCPRSPSEVARIKAVAQSPPPLITYSLLCPPLKCCQFTSLLSFSAELCFCYIKIQQGKKRREKRKQFIFNI